MKTLGLLLAAILVPGAMAMAIEESRPLLESSQQMRHPCSRYYPGCYSSISGAQRPELPRFEVSTDSRFWSALKPSELDSVAEERPWNGTSFYQKLQRLREEMISKLNAREALGPHRCFLVLTQILTPEDHKENAQTAIDGVFI